MSRSGRNGHSLARVPSIPHEHLEPLKQALDESEERYRSIVTAMSEGIVLQDAQGRIIECNESAERILGLTRDQMAGLTSLDPRWQATDEDGRPVPGEEHPIRVTLRTGEPQCDVVMGVRRSDGEQVWVCVNTQPLFREGETAPYQVVASFADITASRRAAAALRDSEERYRALFENSIDGVLLTVPDGRILAANPEACRLLGRTEEEICRVGRAGIVDMSDPQLPAVLAERERTGRARAELRLRRADGTTFPAEVSSGIFIERDGQRRTSLTFRDVSERKEAEEALLDSKQRLEERVEARTRELAALLQISREMSATLELKPLLAVILTQLRTVVSYTGAAIAVVEGEDLRILDYSGPVAREKIIGARVSLELDSGYRRVVRNRAPVIVDDVWSDVGPETAWPVWDASLNRDIGYVRAWLGVPLLAKGRLIGLLRIDHEVAGFFNERHRDQALAFAYQAAGAILNAQLHEQAQLAAALEERQRLARELHDSVTQALYGIALGVHAAETALKDDAAGVSKALGYILRLAEAGLAETRALVFELRPDALATEGLILMLGRQMELLRARDQVTVDAALGSEPAISLAAKGDLYRIAQEALNNAAKHSGAKHISLAMNQDAAGLTLEIRDNGAGFDPDRPYPGHLGLVSMRERAQRAGGELCITSEAGKGTLLRVTLPAGC